jgi:hypothetical protein
LAVSGLIWLFLDDFLRSLSLSSSCLAVDTLRFCIRAATILLEETSASAPDSEDAPVLEVDDASKSPMNWGSGSSSCSWYSHL